MGCQKVELMFLEYLSGCCGLMRSGGHLLAILAMGTFQDICSSFVFPGALYPSLTRKNMQNILGDICSTEAREEYRENAL